VPYISGLEELTLRPGDKVEYVGIRTPNLFGKTGTVLAPATQKGRSTVEFADGAIRGFPYNENLALWIPDYALGDFVRVTPRDGTLGAYDGREGVVIETYKCAPNGTHNITVAFHEDDNQHDISPFARNISLITKGAQNELKVSDVVRIGTEVGVLRALPDTPDGLYEVETMHGDTLYTTNATLEKLT